ncbi:hypothetical protein PR003_g13437 [Phytophthora rubi]|uniref:Uncharacterized protein n=1 Tax=Phytophthora rubi TaxID=129364 RepID=A0A6A4F8V4_9STRA|nr:hypothetical protein PR003_g13437 [Phytophthora rubi]
MTKQITDDLAQALWETLLLHSTKGRLRYGDITAIACEFGLTTKAVTRVWKKGIRSMGDRVAAVVKAGWSRRGRKKSQTRPRTTEDLIEEVEYAFHETSADTLTKTFLTLQSVMLEIMKYGGSNTYKIPHIHKDKLRNAGKLPITLPCDVQVYWSARAAIMGHFLAPNNQDASDLDVFLY